MSKDIKQDTKINLCDTCVNIYPDCMATNVEFGDGVGNDNIIKCELYIILHKGNTDD